jgi:DinB superfamily
MAPTTLSAMLFFSLCFCSLPALSQASGSAAQTAPEAKHWPTSAELSRDETPGKAIMRIFGDQEYEIRSSAEAMPESKWDFRPAPGMFQNEKPQFGPAEVRTFREQVKHVACSNFAFAAQLDGIKPPEACDKGGPSPAQTRAELLTYLRDSFAALKKSLNAITVQNMFDPIKGPYATPNTRLGLAEVAVWHAADHFGQISVYLRLNGIVPPASRPKPPPLQDK